MVVCHLEIERLGRLRHQIGGTLILRTPGRSGHALRLVGLVIQSVEEGFGKGQTGGGRNKVYIRATNGDVILKKAASTD